MNKITLIVVAAFAIFNNAFGQVQTGTAAVTGTTPVPKRHLSEMEIRRDAALKFQIVNLEHQIGVIEATIKRFEELMRRPKATKLMKDENKARIVQQEGLLEQNKKKVEILKREVAELEGLPSPTPSPVKTPPPLGHLMDRPVPKQ